MNVIFTTTKANKQQPNKYSRTSMSVADSWAISTPIHQSITIILFDAIIRSTNKLCLHASSIFFSLEEWQESEFLAVKYLCCGGCGEKRQL
jgi:hypothetical protein